MTKPETTPGQDPIVCVVDDDLSVLRALGRLLRSAGFRVETFSSSEEFLARPLGDGPRCLVLDVRLQGMSGLALSSHLAAAGATVPIILMTGHDDSAWREEAVRVGAIAYLHKPFADETLIDAVQRALGSRCP